MTADTTASALSRVVVVTGLSGAGKSSILRALEDLGYEVVDNPPLPLIADLTHRSEKPLAIGVHAYTRGFDPAAVLETLRQLRLDPAVSPELVYAWAEQDALLRRYTETRRRHPLAPQGRVADGIATEERATAPLRLAADLIVDTSDLAVAALRRLIEQRFAQPASEASAMRLTVSLVSFAFPVGLPRYADLVLDARFLRNPHYVEALRPRTGHDPEVAAFIEADPDFAAFFTHLTELLDLLLPRFVQEGKKYATVAIGCTGGRHRSVHIVEKLSAHLSAAGWRPHVHHRELVREATASGRDRLQEGQERSMDAAAGC
jgi:UPF0042 nucleotide-binding protein